MAKKGNGGSRSTFWDELAMTPEQLGYMIREVATLPGALEQLAEYAVLAPEPDLLEEFVDELTRVPEAMPFLARVAFALETLDDFSPKSLKRIRREAERRGVTRLLNPKSWYPELTGPFRVFVTPSRLRAHFMVVRFLFLESGIQTLWDVNFAGGGLMSAVVLDTVPDDLGEEPWHEVQPDLALSLMQSARWMREWRNIDNLNEGWLFTEVLWQIVTRGMLPRPVDRVAYAMEAEPVNAQSAALAFVNAWCHEDGLLAYDLLAERTRVELPLEALLMDIDGGDHTRGRLWRSWIEKEAVKKTTGDFLIKTWHSTGWGVVERPWHLHLTRARDGRWYITQFRRGRRTLWTPADVQPYLRSTQRYYGMFDLEDAEALPIDMVPDTAVRDRSAGLTEVYSWGPAHDFCHPYDMAEHLAMEWIFVDDRGLILLASGEIAYRRERERLRNQGWIDEPLMEGIADRFQQEFWEEAAELGWDDIVGDPVDDLEDWEREDPR
ncbi:MAG: hypothetical protein OWU33_10705 [Firmicutes bacterium]|nr:hypothetical protein [Bacillota bacterium]